MVGFLKDLSISINDFSSTLCGAIMVLMFVDESITLFNISMSSGQLLPTTKQSLLFTNRSIPSFELSLKYSELDHYECHQL